MLQGNGSKQGSSLIGLSYLLLYYDCERLLGNTMLIAYKSLQRAAKGTAEWGGGAAHQLFALHALHERLEEMDGIAVAEVEGFLDGCDDVSLHTIRKASAWQVMKTRKKR